MPKHDITTASGRNRLETKKEPYWHRISPGNYLGYRKLDDRTGTWIARHRNAEGRQKYHRLGAFQRFDDAEKKARTWFDQCEAGLPEVLNVSEACKRYVEDRRRAKGADTAKDAEGRFKRLIYTKPIGRIELDALRAGLITDWLNAQVDAAEADEDPDATRKAKASANRNLACLKSALNLAYRMGFVASKAQWDRVQAFQKTTRRKERFMTVVERKKLLAAASPALTRLVLGILLTGARPGEIANATVGDLDPAGRLTVNGKTGHRIVPLSPDALAHLTTCAGSRASDAPLLTRPDGKAWTRFDWRDEMKTAREAAGLPDDTVLYNIRHVAITQMIAGGIDPLTVARISGTSVTMIEKHYGHLVVEGITAKLAKVRML